MKEKGVVNSKNSRYCKRFCRKATVLVGYRRFPHTSIGVTCLAFTPVFRHGYSRDQVFGMQKASTYAGCGISSELLPLLPQLCFPLSLSSSSPFKFPFHSHWEAALPVVASVVTGGGEKERWALLYPRQRAPPFPFPSILSSTTYTLSRIPNPHFVKCPPHSPSPHLIFLQNRVTPLKYPRNFSRKVY